MKTTRRNNLEDVMLNGTLFTT